MMLFTKVEEARLQELTRWYKAAEAKFETIEAAPGYKFIDQDPRDPYYSKLYDEMLDLEARKSSIDRCAAYPVGTQVEVKGNDGKPRQGTIVEHRKHSSNPGRAKAYLYPVVQWVGFKRKSLF